MGAQTNRLCNAKKAHNVISVYIVSHVIFYCRKCDYKKVVQVSTGKTGTLGSLQKKNYTTFRFFFLDSNEPQKKITHFCLSRLQREKKLLTFTTKKQCGRTPVRNEGRKQLQSPPLNKMLHSQSTTDPHDVAHCAIYPILAL